MIRPCGKPFLALADGDDILLEDLADSVRAALESLASFGGPTRAPDPVAMPAGHPYATLYLDTVRRNFRVRQEQFLELERTTERPARLGCWTRSFGPRIALMSHARDRAGLAVQDRRG